MFASVEKNGGSLAACSACSPQPPTSPSEPVGICRIMFTCAYIVASHVHMYTEIVFYTTCIRSSLNVPKFYSLSLGGLGLVGWPKASPTNCKSSQPDNKRMPDHNGKPRQEHIHQTRGGLVEGQFYQWQEFAIKQQGKARPQEEAQPSTQTPSQV